jgi:hypothetical protein
MKLRMKDVAIIATLLMAAAWCGRQGLKPTEPAAPIKLTSAAARPSLQPVPQAIETIRVGQRVLGEASAGELAGQTQVDPAIWRLVSLRAETIWADGTLDEIRVETLQPPEWIGKHQASVGASVPLPLDLVEMGLPADLAATVVANEPCPSIAPGSGRVVLTTVSHLNADAYELSVESSTGGLETIRPTGLHKFYFPAANAWISAKDLKPGDELQGVDGPLTVRRIEPLSGVHRVYNMTVEGEHVYRVSTLGALVHNNGCTPGPVPDPRRRHGYDPGAIHDDHPVARALGGDPSVTRAREAAANLRKGGLEGELRKYEDGLSSHPQVSDEMARAVIQDEIESLSRDVIAQPFSSVFPEGFRIEDLDN